MAVIYCFYVTSKDLCQNVFLPHGLWTHGHQRHASYVYVAIRSTSTVQCGVHALISGRKHSVSCLQNLVTVIVV